jgi:DNA invertase Pin-like site-specific DNA recombinase
MSKQPLRVGLYLRVSTTGQTVENQRIDLMRVAEQRGWAVVEEYVDHGISGAKARDKRPAFNKLTQDAAQGKLDVVAAWAIDRVGRSLSHVAAFMAELQDQKVALYLHQQNVDGTTSAGRAMLGMASVFAAFERDMLIERINAGIARARKEGKHLGRPRKSISAKVEAQIRRLGAVDPSTGARKTGICKIAKQFRCGVGQVSRILEQAA